MKRLTFEKVNMKRLTSLRCLLNISQVKQQLGIRESVTIEIIKYLDIRISVFSFPK